MVRGKASSGRDRERSETMCHTAIKPRLSVRTDRFGRKRRIAECGVHVASQVDDRFAAVLEALARRGRHS